MRAALGPVLVLSAIASGCWRFDASLLAHDGGGEPASACDVPLVEGDVAVDEPPSEGPPALGAVVHDPTWGTCVRRLTALRDGSSASPMHRVVENADRTSLLVQTDSYQWVVYDARSLEYAGGLGLYRDDEPYWHPSDPDLVRYLAGSEGPPFAVRDWNVYREIDTDVWDFTDALRAAFPEAARVRPSPGALGRTASADLSRWAIEVLDTRGASLGFAVIDVSARAILGTFEPGRRVSLGLAPSGEHAVRIDCEGASTVHRADDASTLRTFVTFDDCPHDWDFARSVDGRDAIVYATLDWLRAQPLDGVGDEIDLLKLSWDDGEKSMDVRISGTGIGRPGWVAVSFFHCLTGYRSRACATGTRANQDRVVLFELRPEREGRRALNLAWHRASIESSSGFPSLSVSRALDRVHFVSSGGGGGGIDLYEIHVPSSAF